MSKQSSPFLLKLLTPEYFFGSSNGEKIEQPTAFVISTGRTGTKFFADFFNKIDGVYAVHEPKPSRQLRLWSVARQEGAANRDDLIKILRRYRANTIKRTDADIYLESNPFLVGFEDVFAEVFLDPHVIHIVRDPRSYIKSSINHGNTAGLKLLANKYFPHFYTDLGAYEDKSDIVRAAAFWKITNDFILDKSKSVKNFKTFKFEDVFGENQSESLLEIGEYLNIDKTKIEDLLDATEQVNRSKRKVAKSWSEWSSEDCRDVESICRELMDKYGYGHEPEWQQKLSG